MDPTMILSLVLVTATLIWAYYARREAWIEGYREGWRRGYNDAMHWCRAHLLAATMEKSAENYE